MELKTVETAHYLSVNPELIREVNSIPLQRNRERFGKFNFY